MMRFSQKLVAELFQPFWAAWQSGEFMTDAAADARRPTAEPAQPRHEPSTVSVGVQELLTQDVRVPAVLGELAQHVQVDPAQRRGPATVAVHEVVDAEGGHCPARCFARITVSAANDGDGVVLVQVEGLVRTGLDAQRGTRAAGDSFIEPDLPDEAGVLDQAQQRRLRGQKATPRLRLTQPIEALAGWLMTSSAAGVTATGTGTGPSSQRVPRASGSGHRRIGLGYLGRAPSRASGPLARLAP